MRAFCTVSAPLEVCASSAEQLSPGSRFLALRLLGHQQPKTLYFLVDAKCRVKEVYTQTCVHFAGQGMLDTELFGLAVLIDGEYIFADPDSKLSKYGPKSWRSSHTHGLDANGRPLLELHFRVQFYVESPLVLKDEKTRHNYYLQLKYNIVNREIPRDCAEQALILLAGLALQADLGDAPTASSTTTTLSSSSSTSSAASLTATTTSSNNASITESSNALGKQTTEAEPTSATAIETAADATTTLPKICKRWTSANERMLRLSTYVASTSQAAARGGSNVFSRVHKIKPPRVPAAYKQQQQQQSGSRIDEPNAIAKANAFADYFRLEDYLPEALCTSWAASALRSCHRQNHGMSRAEAELQFIRQACLVHETINAHLYRMRMSKQETGPGSVWLVVYAKGVKIISAEPSSASAPSAEPVTLLWPNIGKLSFNYKKFEIRSNTSKFTFHASLDEKARMLLSLCRETHQYCMKTAKRLREIIEMEEQQVENASLHVCFTSSRSLHLPCTKSKNDQRISVISSTSSNTTSGIISDRVHSEDELEIMINTPPVPIAAPSTESLALAHLLDRPSVSRQTSSVGKVSLEGIEEQVTALSMHQAPGSSGDESPIELCNASAANSSTNSGPGISQSTTDSSTATESPNSQHNIGSKCSSTCSTVVITSQSAGNSDDAVNQMDSTIVAHQRDSSTTSSLEIGCFSHTAQNSTVSEADSCGGFLQSSHDETESVSGVYTLAHGAPPTETSGVYTMHSSELTGQSSELAESVKSSQYDLLEVAKSEISDDHLLHDDDHRSNVDSVDGKAYGHGSSRRKAADEEFRLRLNSNISTSGSFRGDGSDPTDTKLTLLSAEELSELIVGRGAYSKRQKQANSSLRSCVESLIHATRNVDAATAKDNVEDLINDLLPTDPPAPPALPEVPPPPLPPVKCIESSNGGGRLVVSSTKSRPPPPYTAHHATTGLCGPPVPMKTKVESKKKTPAVAIATTTTTSVANSTKIKKVPKKSKLEPKAPAAAATSTKLARPPMTATAVPSAATITASVAPVRRRDPPPYPNLSKARPTSLISLNSTGTATSSVSSSSRLASASTIPPKAEEITARFIKSRPHINILKAHTSVVNECAQPSYAAPTPNRAAPALAAPLNASSAVHISASHQRYAGSRLHTQSAMTTANGSTILPNTVGIPIVPYKLHGAHKSMPHHGHHSRMQQPPQQPPPPPYPEVKPQKCMLLPIIKPSQFLTPPPSSMPRQPPPPPPAAAAGVFSRPLELYQQQIYSDVDYVIYPIQDTAVNHQPDSVLTAAIPPHAAPPPAYLLGGWDTCKGHAIYRSTPYLPIALSSHAQYASTQNLSDTYLQLPGTYSPLYSPASLCSAYEPPPPSRPLHGSATAAAAALVTNTTSSTPTHFARSRSDDNILNSLDSLPKVRRLPPPPLPPPYVNRQLKKERLPDPCSDHETPPPIPSKPPGYSSSTSTSSKLTSSSSGLSSNNITAAIAATNRQILPPRRPITLHPNRAGSPMTKTSSGAQWAGERPKPDGILGSRLGADNSSSILAQLQLSIANNRLARATSTNVESATATEDLDIAQLREKSKHLDLPLIAALCNDRSLLKQTKVPPAELPSSSAATSASCVMPAPTTTAAAEATPTTGTTPGCATPPSQRSNSGKGKNLLASLTSVASKTPRKTTATGTTGHHRHPNDKLPPLPKQSAEANNYVMDPALQKHHKSHNNA